MTKLTSAVPVLNAVNFTAAVEFWRDVLGFTGTVHDGFATLECDGVAMFISKVDDQVIPDNTMAWLRATDVERLHADWSARIQQSTFAEQTRVTDLQQQPWGREFVVIDPVGNCVHIASA